MSFYGTDYLAGVLLTLALLGFIGFVTDELHRWWVNRRDGDGSGTS